MSITSYVSGDADAPAWLTLRMACTLHFVYRADRSTEHALPLSANDECYGGTLGDDKGWTELLAIPCMEQAPDGSSAWRGDSPGGDRVAYSPAGTHWPGIPPCVASHPIPDGEHRHPSCRATIASRSRSPISKHAAASGSHVATLAPSRATPPAANSTGSKAPFLPLLGCETGCTSKLHRACSDVLTFAPTTAQRCRTGACGTAGRLCGQAARKGWRALAVQRPTRQVGAGA